MSKLEDTVSRQKKLVEDRLLKKEQEKKELKQLKNDFNKVFGTVEGQNVLGYIMNACGYQKHSVGANPQTGELFIDNTIYNEALRSHYLNLRKFIHSKILVKVEIINTRKKEKKYGK